MKRMEINGRLYDYDTIAQFVERKMNGANVHGLKVSLAVIREVIFDPQADDADKETMLQELKHIGYK